VRKIKKTLERGLIDEVRIVPRAGDWKQRRNETAPFVAWDGEECRDAGYCLFGNNLGKRMREPFLPTERMLSLIIETGIAKPRAFHIGYSFFYDVNQILQDLDRLHIGVLHRMGHVTWRGFRIEYIPHKIFTVSKEGVRVRIDDIFSFFRARYDKPLIKYGVGTEEQQRIISEGKDKRDDFWWKDIDEIEAYWAMELDLMVQLMDKIRCDANSIGFFTGQWHGPGALASYALRQHGMGRHKRETPEEIMEAVTTAFSGGWFERFQAGMHDGPVYTADINSAYVYAASLLPSLADGEWVWMEGDELDEWRKNDFEGCRLGVFHLRMAGNFSTYLASCHGIPLPLFMRKRDDNITHPIAVDGWYWTPEARLVAQDPRTEFVGAWVFRDDGSYPFAWVADMYADRVVMQEEGNPAEKILKWILASIYGRLAQRVGWDEIGRKPPKWHQLEWAGWITSFVRAMIYQAAVVVGRKGGLISIDTDGVMSTVPFEPEAEGSGLETGVGDGLGQWKIESYKGVVYVQNGIWWLKGDGDEWVEPKLRGIPKDRIKDPGLALEAMEGSGKIAFEKRRFNGYGMALQQGWDKWRTWEDALHEIDINYSGNRQHIKKLCRACRAGWKMSECLHDLALLPCLDVKSKPHELPWRSEIEELKGWDLVREYMVEDR
jgi:hypothetical protein